MEPVARVSERWSPRRAAKVELRCFTTEDPMTDDRMALVDLLQKTGDGDFLRAVAEAVLEPPQCPPTLVAKAGPI